MSDALDEGSDVVLMVSPPSKGVTGSGTPLSKRDRNCAVRVMRWA
jgi:hypothetical protein